MATRLIEPLSVDDPNLIKDWLERIEEAIGCQVMQHNIHEDNKARMEVSYFLSNIGQVGYRVLKSYCAPDNPNAKTFAQLKKLIIDNLAPTPTPLSEGYAFSNMKQEIGESCSMFMARLKEKAANCVFGDLYDRMVKDRFIYGLRDQKMRSQLLNKADLTTAAAVLTEVIRRESMDAANQVMSSSVNSIKMQGKSNWNKRRDQPAKARQFQNRKETQVTCSKCTLRGHVAEDCTVKCLYCKTLGHIRKNCYKLRNKSHNVEDVSELQEQQEQNDEEEDPNTYLFYVDVQPPTLNIVPAPTQCASNSYEKSSSIVPAPAPCASNSHEQSSSVVSAQHASNSYKKSSSIKEADRHNVSVVCVENVSNINMNDECFFNSNYHVSEINSISNVDSKPLIQVSLNDKTVNFELDSGSAITCISSSKFRQLELENCRIVECSKTLCVANGQIVHVRNKAIVSIQYKGVSYGDRGLFIVDANFPTLLGRDWIKVIFGPDWLSRFVNHVSFPDENERRQTFIEKIKENPIFRSEIGDVHGYEARLNLKPDARPRFCKARVAAFAIKDKVVDELNKMIADGRLIKVDNSDWASPIVPVVKPDGTIRVCGDYKSTLNPALDTKVYPLPTLEECFKEMVGGQLFTKIDIKQAYNSIRLREEDQILTTLSTGIGLLKWCRLPYGINSAGAQFQSIIDEVLLGISHTCCRVDDILITGRNDDTHMANVQQVVTRLEDAGFRCRIDKSYFMQKSVIYLGHEVSAQGIRPVDSKVGTLVEAPYPCDREQLISFLGAVQYYARYLPNMATVIEPLNRLRPTSAKWVFGEKEKQAYQDLKKMLVSDRVLTFYNPELPLVVDSDASSVGLGGVLSHIMPNGEEKPIEFASRTMTSAERRYSQIDREALSIVWSLKKFHKYLYARPFTLRTDHEPLKFIFHPHKGIPEMIISRLQRWAIILSCYDYTIQFRPTGKHSNADVCSRFPLPNPGADKDAKAEESVFAVYIGEDKPLLNCALISKLSRTDPIVSKVLHYVLEGWPQRPATSRGTEVSGKNQNCESLIAAMKKAESRDTDESTDKRPVSARNTAQLGDSSDGVMPYYKHRAELSVDSGCLMWGARVVIPEKMRKDVLQLLHGTHMGSSSMKNMARRYLWWPGLDVDIENVSKRCPACQLNQPMPKSSVPHPWNPAEHPWDRIHIDFAGPFKGCMWLIVVCAYSKWIEVVNMNHNTTAPNLIKKLREIFSRFGLCRTLVSDNGPQLSKSHEFTNFLEKNGIRYIPIPSYHPASNGQAEVMVGKFKQAMKKMSSAADKDIHHCLANWLFEYRNTPHTTTGFEPAVLMFGRRPRTALSLLSPLSNDKQKDKILDQRAQIVQTDKRPREFAVGDSILYRNILHNKWMKGTVKSLEGSQICMIGSEDNGSVRKHIDHIVHVPKDGEPIPVVEQFREKGVAVNEPRHTERVEYRHNSSENPVSIDSNEQGQMKPESSLGHSSKNIASSIAPSVTLASIPAIVDRPKRSTRPPDRLAYDKKGGPAWN